MDSKKVVEVSEDSTTIQTCAVCNGPLVFINDTFYCKVCADRKFEKENTYSQWLQLLSKCIAFCFPVVLLGVVLFCSKFYSIGSKTGNDVFWLWMAFPVCFFSAIPVFLLVRKWIWKYFWGKQKSLDGPVGWFDIQHAVKDISVISITVAFAFTMVSYAVYKSLPASGVVFREIPELPYFKINLTVMMMWFLRRGIFLFACAALSVLILIRMRLINTAAFLPRGNTEYSTIWVFLYSFILPFPYLVIQQLLFAVSLKYHTVLVIEYSLALFITGSLMLLSLATLMQREKSLNSELIGAIPSFMAMIGESASGKTVFLARSWYLLSTWQNPEFSFQYPESEGNQALEDVIDELRNGDKPNVTLDFENCPFILKHLGEDILHFNWLDVAGGIFNVDKSSSLNSVNMSDQHKEARKQFLRQLSNADCVLMVIPAIKLVQRDLDFSPYIKASERLYKERRQLGRSATPVPLAIVITQCCRLTPFQRRNLERLVSHLVRNWTMMATKSFKEGNKRVRLAKPAVRVWKTSAVVTKPDSNGVAADFPPPWPHRSQNCAEPVLWLAAQVMRNHVPVLERTAGFNNRSELQDLILRLEAMANAQALG